MRSKNWQHMVDGRNAHHDVKDRQIHTAENGGKKIDPEASQRKMQTAKNNEEQRNNMNHFHNTNLTLSVGSSHIFFIANSSGKIRRNRGCGAP